jgi:xanthine dehydrogenase accessory factor
MDQDVFEALAAARRDGRSVALATTVRTEGDPPSAAGNRALFAADGALLAGTVGCNGLDRKAGRDGAALLAAGERGAVRSYTSFEGEPGAGLVEVFVEAFRAGPVLLVGGRGPVADALAALGAVLGLRVTADPAIGAPAFAAAAGRLGTGDGVVFVDHDDPDLVAALAATLAGAAGYVGVMGSRRHTPGFVAGLRDRLAATPGPDGPGRLGRVHSPTGLDLGARTPPEIALAILAELLAVTRSRPGGPLTIVPTA